MPVHIERDPAGPAARTACLIVHFGDQALTAQALRSVAACVPAPALALVVDNDPTTLAPECIPSGVRARAIRTERNVGFAQGVNIGLAALDDSIEFVWLLNNDAWAEPEALAALLDAEMRLERHAIVSSLVMEDGTGTPWFRRAAFLPWRLAGRHYEDSWSHEDVAIAPTRATPASVPYVPFCSVLIPTALFRQVGYLDPSFFLYGEDVDFCRRAARAGWTIAIANRSVVHHRPSSSTDPATAARFAAASSLRLTARYYPWLLPLAVPLSLGAGLVRAIQRRQVWRLSARMLGYRDAAPGILTGPRRTDVAHK